MSASRPVLLSVTFLEDVAVGAMFFTAGTTVSMEEGVARGLQHSSVQINGPGSAGTAVLPNGGGGGGGGGSTTLAALTDMGSYDIGSNNPSVTAIKNTANAAATSAALTAEAATARAAEAAAQATANAAIPASQKAAASGVATLDGTTKLPTTQLPATIDGGSASAAGPAINVRHDTAANWTSTNPVLAAGEQGVESNTKRRKTGDGSTAWNSLVYDTNSPPVALTGATNLTALAHGNRQITFTGANAILTVQNDVTAGWADDASITVQTLAGSAGVPTISTPDGKTITGSVNQPIGATRKGANSWDVYLLPQVPGGGSTLSTFGAGTAFGYVSAPYNFTTLASVGTAGAPNTAGTVGFAAVGTTAYSQLNRVTYTGTVNSATSSHVSTPLCFSLGFWRQRVVVNAACNDAMGNTAPFFMGWSSALAAFSTVALQPADNSTGAVIGVGWKGDGTQSNLQLITAPSSGGGTYTDLGASFPIPAAGATASYQLELNYYPTSDPGGRRVLWKVTEQITGNTTSGTITANLIAQATAQSYTAGAARWTVNGTSAAPVLDFSGIYFGVATQWAP